MQSNGTGSPLNLQQGKPGHGKCYFKGNPLGKLPGAVTQEHADSCAVPSFVPAAPPQGLAALRSSGTSCQPPNLPRDPPRGTQPFWNARSPAHDAGTKGSYGTRESLWH